jgi:hypothetical protein
MLATMFVIGLVVEALVHLPEIPESAPCIDVQAGVCLADGEEQQCGSEWADPAAAYSSPAALLVSANGKASVADSAGCCSSGGECVVSNGGCPPWSTPIACPCPVAN